jgi:hypothetical protein
MEFAAEYWDCRNSASSLRPLRALCVSAVRAKVRYLSTMNHLELDP